VLLRAAEPLEGLEVMAANRGTDDVRRLCRGPARLAQALAVDRSCTGADLLHPGEVWLEPGDRVAPSRITATRRIGISSGIEELWRWVETGSPWATPTPGASRSPVAPTR
jgi:DNA-3-methyladenine glycosylase